MSKISTLLLTKSFISSLKSGAKAIKARKKLRLLTTIQRVMITDSAQSVT